MEKIPVPWKAPGTVFAQKDKKFGEDGIMKLPEKWQKVVEQNSDTLFNKVLGENEKMCL